MKGKLTPTQDKLTPSQEQIIQVISMVIENNIYCQKMANESMATAVEKDRLAISFEITRLTKHNEEMARINIQLIQKILQSGGVGTGTIELTEFLGRYTQIKYSH